MAAPIQKLCKAYYDWCNMQITVLSLSQDSDKNCFALNTEEDSDLHTKGQARKYT